MPSLVRCAPNGSGSAFASLLIVTILGVTAHKPMLSSMSKASKPMSAREVFARNLGQTRRLKNLSQEALALQAGLSRTYLSEVERGTRKERCQGQFEGRGGRPTGRTAAKRPVLASTHERKRSVPSTFCCCR